MSEVADDDIACPTFRRGECTSPSLTLAGTRFADLLFPGPLFATGVVVVPVSRVRETSSEGIMMHNPLGFRFLKRIAFRDTGSAPLEDNIA